MAKLAETARPKDKVVIGPAELDRAALQLAGAIDPVNGGVRGAPKFPNSMMPVLCSGAPVNAAPPIPSRQAGEGREAGAPLLVELDAGAHLPGGIYS